MRVGSGEKALFWHASWLNGSRPKDIAPLIFERSKMKKCTVAKALEGDFWVAQINTQGGLTFDHILQFSRLWEMLQSVQLNANALDSITWKLSSDGCYSSKTSYNMQFLGQTISTMPCLVWKSWAPPKCKIFAWLIIQNRVWTADRLAKRGWPNCGRCKLCNQGQESADHLLFKCRFTTRVWVAVKDWLVLQDVDPYSWQNFHSVKEWWSEAIHKSGQSRKAMISLAMLMAWEIWKERNARVFRNTASTANMVITKIREEAVLWGLAGAKALSTLMSRE